MNNPVQMARRLRRRHAARRGVGLVLLAVAAFGSSMSRADPGDFQAMPGLWKTVVYVISQGKQGQPTIHWHCVDEGADPWAAFADMPVPDEPCERGDEHRSSTALAWTLNCSGHPPVHGRGHVDFDSAEHYTAGIALQDRAEVVRVEGRRYAACTSPSD